MTMRMRVYRELGLWTVASVAVFLVFGAYLVAVPPGDPLPSVACSSLKAERAKYGATVTPAQAAAILNASAWAHKTLGLGMAGKSGGTTCPLSNGKTIACDYLVRQSDNVGWDVLVDSDSTARVTCSAAGVVMASNRPWVAPVDPGTGPGPGPVPPDCPTCPTCPTCPPAGSHPVSAAQFQALEAAVKALEARVAVLEQAQYSVNLSTSSNWGHSHQVTGAVTRVP